MVPAHQQAAAAREQAAAARLRHREPLAAQAAQAASVLAVEAAAAERSSSQRVRAVPVAQAEPVSSRFGRMADLEVGQEIKIRAKALFDQNGQRVIFQGTLTALNAGPPATGEAILRFNGMSLGVSNVPVEMIAAADQGTEVDE